MIGCTICIRYPVVHFMSIPKNGLIVPLLRSVICDETGMDWYELWF